MLYELRRLMTGFALITLFAIVFDVCASNTTHVPVYFSIQFDTSLSRKNLALIIPGLHQTCSDPGYDSIGAFYKKNGITPMYVTINWKAVGFKKLAVTAMQLHEMLNDSFPESNYYLFGFSFGAVISLKLLQLMHVEQVLLCSMSPIFEEDKVHQIFPFRQILGWVTNYSSNALSYGASKEACLIFLYGNHDSFAINKAIIKSRVEFFSCDETHIIPKARHNISNHSYLLAIQQIVQRIGK